MDDEKRLFPGQNPNPRSLALGFLSDRAASSSSGGDGGAGGGAKASASSDLPPRPPPPILERFRLLLKERDDHISDSGDASPPPPSTDEIVAMYEDVLSELIFNSKPIITELTIIAGEHKDHGPGIAEAICSRILEVPIDQKLPSLYLLDSIVKNIGRDYMRHFAVRLPEVFCEAYRQVLPSLHPAMRHLFGTWSVVFPSSVLRKIESELQFSPRSTNQPSSLTNTRPSESPSPRPAHGIHVNPKYLEARRQFGHSGVICETDPRSGAQMTDFEAERTDRNALASPKGWSAASPKFHVGQGVPSSLHAYGQKSTVGYGDYDFDDADVAPSQIEADKVQVPVNGKLSRTSSSRIQSTRSPSPSCDGFVKDNTPETDLKRVSPSLSRFGFPLNRVGNEDMSRSDWRERWWPDDGTQKIQTSSVNSFNSGYDPLGPRALIDAYGNYRGKGISHDSKLPKVQQLDVNGINSNVGTRKWKNSEEEEYDWTAMSPTLGDLSRDNNINPSDSSFGSVRAGLGRPDVAIFEPAFRKNEWQSQNYISQSGRGSIITKSLSGMGTQNGSLSQYQGSHYAQDPLILPHHYPQSSVSYYPKPRGIAVHMPFAATGIATSEAEFPSQRFSSALNRIGTAHGDSSNVENLPRLTPPMAVEKNLSQRPQSPPTAPIVHPPIHTSHPLPLIPRLGSHNGQIKSQFEYMDANKSGVNLSQNNSSTLPLHQLDSDDGKSSNSSKVLQLTHSRDGLLPLNRPIQEHPNHMQTPALQAQDAHIFPTPPQLSSQLPAQPLNYGNLQGQGAPMGAILPNVLPGTSLSLPHPISGTSFRLAGVALPPLPPGPPPVSSQMGAANTPPIISNPPGAALSGLITSLVAQGLISLTTPATTTVKDSVGVEFNADLLKVRHDSAITALFSDLPRQCTTCGLRFKFQEEHRNHMDWHVTKNRLSKNRKQNPSRKWFVSAKEWLSGAETLGTDAVPGFLPSETVAEKRDNEEMAVPADENQSVCALCGEPFDDFYSDETEEWMYKGAVYLNAPDGSVEGMERSLLGPIVHAKCRSSESTGGSSDDFGLDEGGNNEEDGQRKRMRF